MKTQPDNLCDFCIRRGTMLCPLFELMGDEPCAVWCIGFQGTTDGLAERKERARQGKLWETH